MNNQKLRSLDDVLDYYLISSEERGASTRPEMIELYPQYEWDLRELSAFRKLQESLPERTYTDEEETALKDRGVSIVQAIFREKQSRTQRGPSMLNPDNATLEWCAKWIEDSLRAETNERTIEFGRNMAMTIRAVHAAPPAPDEADKVLARKLIHGLGSINKYEDRVDLAIAALAQARKEGAQQKAKDLRVLYERIFVVRSTGDRKHPVQGVIDYDAKAAFDAALESASKQERGQP